MTRLRRDILMLVGATAMLLGSAGAQPAADAPAEPVAGAQLAASAPAAPAAAVETGSIASQPAGIESRPLARKSGSSTIGYAQTLAALGIVAALILLARAAMKRLGGGSGATSDAPMQILSRLHVAPKQQLMLVRLGKRLVLVGAGSAGFSALGEVTEPGEVEQLVEASRQATFGQTLRRTVERTGAGVKGEATNKAQWRLSESEDRS